MRSRMREMNKHFVGAVVLVVTLRIGTCGATCCYTVPNEYRSGLWEAFVDGQPNGVASARTCDPPFDKK